MSTDPNAAAAPARTPVSAEIHHDHRDVNGGWLRPAVFGAMDGLVSNFALMSGVAGGTSGRADVLLAGLAGLVAGAVSMAAGEYVSVTTQAELAEAEIAIERAEILDRPDAEQRELAEMYVARGVDRALAEQVAEQLSRDPELALDIHVREELGLDPDDLPRPWLAAFSSFVSFSIGAAIPLLPYLFGATALWPAAVCALIGLFVAGVLAARVTGRSWWFSALRQVTIGAAAAGITYVVGDLVGAHVG